MLVAQVEVTEIEKQVPEDALSQLKQLHTSLGASRPGRERVLY